MCNPATVFSVTIAEDRVFSVFLGNFLYDVELKNITFSTGVLTVQECTARGYTIQEHSFPNKTKGFSLHVPFDADVVLKSVCKPMEAAPVLCIWSVNDHMYLQNPEALVTQYVLHLSMGLLIVPEEMPFSHTVQLQASLQDVG